MLFTLKQQHVYLSPKIRTKRYRAGRSKQLHKVIFHHQLGLNKIKKKRTI